MARRNVFKRATEADLLVHTFADRLIGKIVAKTCVACSHERFEVWVLLTQELLRPLVGSVLFWGVVIE